MFGMLDYRAHKLYLIIFGLPMFALQLIAMFGLPLLSYSLGMKVAEDRFWQILSSVGIAIVVEFLWLIVVVVVVSKLITFLFQLIVDIIPADGRNREEALQVVWHGDKAIVAQQFEKQPNTWSEDLPERFINLDWVARWFFRERIEKRIEKIRDYYEENPGERPSGSKYDEVINATGNQMRWDEKILTNPGWRREIYRVCFFLWLLYEHPFK